MITQKILQPDIDLLGIRIQEPITSLTDIFITILCIYVFVQLHKLRSPEKSVFFMKWYFLFTGLAFLFGGLFGHAFQYALSPTWKLAGWFTSMISIIFIERATIAHLRPYLKPIIRKSLLWLNVIELLALMALTAYTLDLLYVKIHSAYGFLAIVLPFHLWVFIKTKNLGSRYILYAIGSLVVILFISSYPVILDKWFTHNDFAHIVMLLTILLMYAGTKNFGKLEKTNPLI